MIYLDNAATSFFKPKTVLECLAYDLKHSANSGRSGHRYALDAAMKIEDCRSFLLSSLNCGNDYELVFTKNCTEALNLGIFGYIKDGMRVVTTANEHNSVLRPLFELKNQGKITLLIINPTDDGTISPEHLDRSMENADFCVVSAASNVTGAKINLLELGNSAKRHNVPVLLDAAQALPYIDIDLGKIGIDMLAAPGHKGLHGVQGTGFLVFKKGLALKPLLFGGTGTASDSPVQPIDAPESYEAGTLFAGGIAALHAGAKWSYQNRERSVANISELSRELMQYLKALHAEVYTKDPSLGVISFNIKGRDSSEVSNILSERDIAVRSGLHCAPLIHKHLETLNRGAVRVSIGVDNTQTDIYKLISVLETISPR